MYMISVDSLAFKSKPPSYLKEQIISTWIIEKLHIVTVCSKSYKYSTTTADKLAHVSQQSRLSINHTIMTL